MPADLRLTDVCHLDQNESNDQKRQKNQDPSLEWDVRKPKSSTDWRLEWLESVLLRLADKTGNSRELLDVGAGEAPYRQMCEELGYAYFSHDFMAYDPLQHDSTVGLTEADWRYSQPHIVCDILEIPENRQYDVILCTDVLEHVPDAVRALEKLCALAKPGGWVVAIAPLLSIMHQPPYWFRPGLSPQFFMHHIGRVTGMHIESLAMVGDYSDFMKEEVTRFLELSRQNQKLPRKTFSWCFRLFTRPTVAVLFFIMTALQPRDRLLSASKGVVMTARKQK